MSDIELIEPVDREAELDRLAARYRAADSVGIRLLNMVGGQAEGLLERLPRPVRSGLDGATEKALTLALAAARRSRGRIPDQRPWVNTALTTAMGAAGGFGGLPSALGELPMTPTVLMRAIQAAAAENGFDPSLESVQFDCLRVFGSAGPLERDDGADLAFVSLRLTLSGGAVQKLIRTVAPKLAVVLGQKLAAQTVPVLGAVAGATANYLFTRYYQEVAQVHFGLRRLAINADCSEAELIAALRERMDKSIAR